MKTMTQAFNISYLRIDFAAAVFLPLALPFQVDVGLTVFIPPFHEAIDKRDRLKHTCRRAPAFKYRFLHSCMRLSTLMLT
jgi:hypothetical protein